MELVLLVLLVSAAIMLPLAFSVAGWFVCANLGTNWSRIGNLMGFTMSMLLVLGVVACIGLWSLVVTQIESEDNQGGAGVLMFFYTVLAGAAYWTTLHKLHDAIKENGQTPAAVRNIDRSA